MIRLRVPGTLAYRNLALRIVSDACKMAQQRNAEDEGDELENQAVSAFGEAFNNVAIHGYNKDSAGDLEIAISWSSEDFVIEMTDFGRSFDPSLIDLPDLDELPEGGMGLFIIRSFMDEVCYKPGPPNVLRLVKRREGSVRTGEDALDTPQLVPVGINECEECEEREEREAKMPPPSQSNWRMKAVVPQGDIADAKHGSLLHQGDVETRAIGGSRRT